MRAAVARRLAGMRPGTALSAVLFGVGVAACFVTVDRLNLPEQWVIFCGSALILGFAVGRGWALFGAIVILAALWYTGPGAGESNSYAILVFLPLAVLSIAAGILAHRGIARLTAPRTDPTSRDKTLWDRLLRGGQDTVGRG